MPPKDSKKPKADVKKEVSATPEKQKTKAKPAAKTPAAVAETPKKTAASKTPATPASTATSDTPNKTPKKKPTTTSFTALMTEGGLTQVNVEVEGENGHALQRKANNFGKILRISATETFTVVNTFTFTSGDLEGHQAIIIRPAKAFNFKALSPEIRNRFYRLYFASKGIVGSDIVLDGKRPLNKEVFAKTYAQGLKNRVGLLALNKEFSSEAHDIFYSHTIRFDSSATLIDFLSQVPKPVLARLHHISLKNYNKTSARNAMHFLSEATNIQTLRVEQGVVVNEQDIVKAAKAVHGDMYKFLDAIGKAKGDKAAGVDVLRLGRQALTYKDKKGEPRNWTAEAMAEFKENLKAKMRASHLIAWVCICGCLVPGHTCADELQHRQLLKRENNEWMHIGHGGREVLAAVV